MTEVWDIETYRKFMNGEKVVKSKKSKYKNVKVEFDGMTFDSKRELEYYKRLLLLKRSGEVTKIDRQVVFEINAYPIDGRSCQSLCKYVADFVITKSDGSAEVIDVKGVRTPVYKLKKKLLKLLYEIEIIEV